MKFIFLEFLRSVPLRRLQIWEIHSQYFLSYFFCMVFFSLSFWDSDGMNVGGFLLSHRPGNVCSFFLVVFSLVFRTGHSSWLVFQFPHFFFCHPHEPVTPSVKLLLRRLCPTSLKLLLGSSFYLLFLR